MEITYDAEKRALTLEHRGVDFEDAEQAFAGPTLTVEDDKKDYGETRYLTFGLLNGRMVAWSGRRAASGGT